MFLVSTANKNYWKGNERILFLGDWCKDYQYKQNWSELKYETLPANWDKEESFKEHYKYLEQIYEKYLNSLASSLNDYHKEQHSERYWRITIGIWLNTFIYVIYDRYLSIKSAINSNKVTHTWVPPINFEWVPEDTKVFVLNALRDNNYNLFLYSKIIIRLGKIPFEFKENQAFSNQKDQAINKLSCITESIKRNIKSLLGKVASKIPDRYSQIVFFENDLSLVDCLKLNFSLGQIPFLVSGDVASSIVPIKKDQRKNLKLPQASNEFESLLNEILIGQIPMSFLENYSELRKKSLDAFPKNPKVIVTSYGQIYNDSFKFWAATQIDKGAKLVIHQHGGGYGMLDDFVFENHEMKICDKFFTWGWVLKKENKLVSLASLKLSNSKYNKKPDLKGEILWVTTSGNKFFGRIDHIIQDWCGSDYFPRQTRFLNILSPEVVKILMVRFGGRFSGFLNWKKQLTDVCPSIKTCKGEKSMLSQLQKSRLCLHDYMGTTWLETLSINFPTIVFFNMSRIKVRKSVQPYLDDLCRVKILHDSPESAANLVNEIYEDPLTWWMAPERQKVKDKFCYQFARTSKNFLEEWKAELLKLTN